MDGIAAVGTARVVEVDGIEGRYFLIALLMAEQVVVSDLREVGKFVVVDILGISFFDLLFDKLIYNGVALPEPGVPSTMVARNGFTILIQPPFQHLL